MKLFKLTLILLVFCSFIYTVVVAGRDPNNSGPPKPCSSILNNYFNIQINRILKNPNPTKADLEALKQYKAKINSCLLEKC